MSREKKPRIAGEEDLKVKLKEALARLEAGESVEAVLRDDSMRALGRSIADGTPEDATLKFSDPRPPKPAAPAALPQVGGRGSGPSPAVPRLSKLLGVQKN